MPHETRTRLTTILAFALIALAVGCRGDIGPMGPQGPQGSPGATGAQGPAGAPYNYFVGSAVVGSNRMADIHLPAGAGTQTRPPSISCYIGDGTGFLLLGTDLSGPTCGMVWLGSNWRVRIIDSPPGWIALVVAVW
jgi:hypothetical protein